MPLPERAIAGPYAAFTFVDRITVLEDGVAAEGTFHVPAGTTRFPSSLLAEATGQLAAWVAVARLGFRLRPVAGIARETVYSGAPRAGDTLATRIRIDYCEDDAVAYQGSCCIDGTTVLELHDCVGPMLPLAEFDEPQAMRTFYDVLRTTGARVDRFPGIDHIPLVALACDEGTSARARLDIPCDAPLFADHFPRRPVFPGTLLLDCMTTLAAITAKQVTGREVFARRVSEVKLRSFIAPGATLTLDADIEREGERVMALLAARAEGQRKPVGTAQVEFEVRH